MAPSYHDRNCRHHDPTSCKHCKHELVSLEMITYAPPFPTDEFFKVFGSLFHNSSIVTNDGVGGPNPTLHVRAYGKSHFHLKLTLPITTTFGFEDEALKEGFYKGLMDARKQLVYASNEKEGYACIYYANLATNILFMLRSIHKVKESHKHHGRLQYNFIGFAVECLRHAIEIVQDAMRHPAQDDSYGNYAFAAAGMVHDSIYCFIQLARENELGLDNPEGHLFQWLQIVAEELCHRISATRDTYPSWRSYLTGSFSIFCQENRVVVNIAVDLRLLYAGREKLNTSGHDDSKNPNTQNPHSYQPQNYY